MEGGSQEGEREEEGTAQAGVATGEGVMDWGERVRGGEGMAKSRVVGRGPGRRTASPCQCLWLTSSE